jgi:hypothetical protein
MSMTRTGKYYPSGQWVDKKKGMTEHHANSLWALMTNALASRLPRRMLWQCFSVTFPVWACVDRCTVNCKYSVNCRRLPLGPVFV